jgi:antitoxin (DNA-binding transcriptional repressor) of toxin-antitoxin stability system
METVAGVRDLKNNLSQYLKEVNRRSITVMKGKVVTRLSCHQLCRGKLVAQSGLGTGKVANPRIFPPYRR